jgi:hypothetical protein
MIEAALSFNIKGGDNGNVLGLLFGAANSISNPDIMPSGSLNVRLTGGKSDDTISAMIWLDPRSLGQITAKVLGGAGNDDLTLDIFGAIDPSIVNALINGGTGRNTAHHTANAPVINCDVVYLDT